MNKIDFELELIKLEKEEKITPIRQAASRIHDINVNQRYGDLPYSVHLDAVAANVMKYAAEIVTSNDDILPIIFAAYFHDSIEDARLTYNDVFSIADSCGLEYSQAELATNIVYALTSEKGKTRDEREGDSYFTGLFITKYSPLVKACDRLANIKNSYITKNSMFSKYAAEMPKFIEAFNRCLPSVEFKIPDDLLAILIELSEQK